MNAKKPRQTICLLLAGACLLAAVLFGPFMRAFNQSAVTEETATPGPPPTAASTPTLSPTPAPTPSAAPAPTAKVMLPYIQAMRDAHGNDDIVGHLHIPGTTIDYAITHTTDNEFYLGHDINQNPDIAGWPYMDFENDPAADTDWNTIIYGHNMNRDYMFHALRHYADEAFYQTHRYAVYTTLYERQLWEVFAFCRADASRTGTAQFPYIRVHFDSHAQFAALVAQIKQNSVYNTGIGFDTDTRVLSLSTCTGETDWRYVLSLVPVTDFSSVPEEVRVLLAE